MRAGSGRWPRPPTFQPRTESNIAGPATAGSNPSRTSERQRPWGRSPAVGPIGLGEPMCRSGSPATPSPHPSSPAQTLELCPELTAVRCPTLVVVGEHDPLVPPASAAEILEAIPAGLGTLRVIRDAAHNVFIDNPQETYAVVRKSVRASSGDSEARLIRVLRTRQVGSSECGHIRPHGNPRQADATDRCLASARISALCVDMPVLPPGATASSRR